MEFVPVAYEHQALAKEIGAEGLPSELAETIRSGWWTVSREPAGEGEGAGAVVGLR